MLPRQGNTVFHPDWRTKIPYAAQCSKKTNKQKKTETTVLQQKLTKKCFFFLIHQNMPLLKGRENIWK